MATEGKPVTHTTAWRIQQYIVSEGLAAGDRMPSQRELAHELGVSRNSLREAFATLSFMGVVDVQPGRGVYVGDTTFRHGTLSAGSAQGEQGGQGFSYVEVYQLRFALEAQTARLAARRATAGDIRALREANARLNACMETRRLSDAAQHDYEFHMGIAGIAGNAIMRDVLARYQPLVLESQTLPLYALARLPEAVAEHEMLIDAIESGDPLLAEHMVHHHLLRAADRTGTKFSTS